MPRGRKPGSKNKPKVSPLVEEKFEKALDKAAKESGIKPKGIVELAKEFVPSKMEAIAPVVEDLMLVKEKLEQLKQKPTQVHGKRIDVDAIPETPFPKDWITLSKIDKLAWLTEHKKK